MAADSQGASMPSPVDHETPSPLDDPSSRRLSMATRVSSRMRTLSRDFGESSPPAGFMAASSEIASSAVAGGLSRRNSANAMGQMLPRRQTMPDESIAQAPRESVEDQARKMAIERDAQGNEINTASNGAPTSNEKDATGEAISNEKSKDSNASTDAFENGYHFPPSYPKGEAFKHGLISFLRYSITPMGFCVVLYGLNVVAWGGMLFLLLCNAAPAMCYPNCNDINSPRRKWVEYDSQVLTALFSLTGFGMAPWRFRDLWYLLKYRVVGKKEGLLRLAGIHRDWFRLPGSSSLPANVGPDNIETLAATNEVPEACVPVPPKKIPDAPLTGVRAEPTKVWKLDFVIWMMVWNTLFQCVLSGFMWGMNRYDRPSWSTGLFVALGCISAAVGGIMMFVEGRKVKSVEGMPLTDRDRARLARDKELGIPHYNNIKDKPEEKKEKKDKKKSDVES